MNTPLFVTGIGTGVGKTVISAILTEQLKADYWKPVQAGDLNESDRYTVSSLVSNTQTFFYPETFRFKMAASPHKAAASEQVKIQKQDFKLPQRDKKLIIEGAGGLMVPLSDTLLMIDLIQLFQAEAILVIRNYLGCINHSLLSFEALLSRKIPIRKIVLNGEMDKDTTRILINYFPDKTKFAKVPELNGLCKQRILNCPNLLSTTI